MSEYVNLKILAVTRMLNEICVAGVDESHTWMRPVRQTNLNLLKSDIFQENKCVLRNYNVVRFLSKRRLNNVPHSEDFLVDWSYKPTIIKELDPDARKILYRRMDQTKDIKNNISSYLKTNKRSLVLVKPDEINGCSWVDSFSGKYKPRIRFNVNNIPYDFSCTDLRWRAFGRESKNRSGSMDMLNTKDIYFVIGLTRKFREDYWPMVVGVHTIPDMKISIDYSNL